MVFVCAKLSVPEKQKSASKIFFILGIMDLQASPTINHAMSELQLEYAIGSKWFELTKP